ncbi:MAG: tyrosine-type recombinase/integrase, partial [Candidatus Sulfotelmatobacter sp.]
HNFRHSLATALVKLKVDPKTVQGVLRHEDFGTTMELYAQSDMDAMRDAQGKFLEQLMGDRIHLLTERVQRESGVGSCVGNFGSRPPSSL